MSIQAMTEQELREDIASMESAARQYRAELRRRLEENGVLPEDPDAIVRIRNGAVFRRSSWEPLDRWDAFGESVVFKTRHVAALAEQHGFDVIWPKSGGAS